eukprot:11349657-Heterocapsa_arctica.AAC.1
MMYRSDLGSSKREAGRHPARALTWHRLRPMLGKSEEAGKAEAWMRSTTPMTTPTRKPSLQKAQKLASSSW